MFHLFCFSKLLLGIHLACLHKKCLNKGLSSPPTSATISTEHPVFALTTDMEPILRLIELVCVNEAARYFNIAGTYVLV